MPWIRKRQRTAVKEERRVNNPQLHASCRNCGGLVTIGWKVGDPSTTTIFHRATGTRACEPDQVLPGLYLEPSDLWNVKRAEV